MYARIIEQSSTAKERQSLLAEYAEHPYAGGEDIEEHLDVLREAISARNGWKRILCRCAPPKRRGKEITVTSNLPELRGVFPWERVLLATRADELLRAIASPTENPED